MYEGSIRVRYLDEPHMYYAQHRINYGLPVTDEKAWGKQWRPKGTTTILGDTLEKKGLQLWPMGLALSELFGFYNFTNENGDRLTGFKKDTGTVWKTIFTQTREEMLDVVMSASKAHTRKMKTGADIGSLVHDAAEQYTLGTPFDLTLEKYEEGQDFAGSSDARIAWLVTAPAELVMAQLAYDQFKLWWESTKPKLINAEQIVYSKSLDYSGAYDALLDIGGRIILVDYKTSNASKSAGAPEGAYYSYFIQSAAYAHALLEMGAVDQIDDLLIVSARKDGKFNTVYASDLGLSVGDAIAWWKAVVHCYRMMDKTKRALVAHAK